MYLREQREQENRTDYENNSWAWELNLKAYAVSRLYREGRLRGNRVDISKSNEGKEVGRKEGRGRGGGLGVPGGVG